MLLEIFLDDNLKIYTIFREQYGLVSTPMYVCISVCMYVIISCSTFFFGGGALGPDQHFLTGRIRIRTKMVDGKNMLEFMASLLAHRYENI